MQKKVLIYAVSIFIILILFSVSYLVFFDSEKKKDTTKEETITPPVIRPVQQEVIQKIKAFKMKKLIRQRDLILRKENFTQISDYQKYVTPDNSVVNSYVLDNNILNIQQAYQKAVSWTWVSDSTLHGRNEKWLMPEAFIEDTPLMPSNPVSGMASDCESQAYTLVSIIENTGFAKTNIRVVVGEVNFSGEVGGHAWVQIYMNGEWFELEATSGPYWDDDDQKKVVNSGFDFDYFQNYNYPVVEYWAFFNDAFYYNPDTGKKSPNLPTHWFNA